MSNWPRIGGLRVVMSWPDSQFAPDPPPPRQARRRFAGAAGVTLLAGGVITIAVAVLAQQHAPAPSAAAAGRIGSVAKGPALHRSVPVSVSIPAIGVRSRLLQLGLNRDGTIAVPSLLTDAGQAAWYKYSVTPGQIGTAVIEGHVDNYRGPAVFFRLGALRPGDRIDVTLADGVTAVFRVTGVRAYAKQKFPTKIFYGRAGYAALHLVTCGGTFDYTTRHYLSSVVVFAALSSARRSGAG